MYHDEIPRAYYFGKYRIRWAHGIVDVSWSCNVFAEPSKWPKPPCHAKVRTCKINELKDCCECAEPVVSRAEVRIFGGFFMDFFYREKPIKTMLFSWCSNWGNTSLKPIRSRKYHTDTTYSITELAEVADGAAIICALQNKYGHRKHSR